MPQSLPVPEHRTAVVCVELEAGKDDDGRERERDDGKPQERQHAPRRVDIQVLRALAVSAVLLFHLGWVQGGFVGVDIFFVISGFLLVSPC
eukprot:m51a1_g5259 putative C-tail anchored protein (91) ;mRNA; r:102420-102745